MDVLDELAGLGRRVRALLGQPAYFVGDDGEPLAVLAGPRRLDRGVERQEIRHVGELADRRNEAGDAAAHLAELLDLTRALADERLEGDEAFNRFANLRAVAAGDFARCGRGARRPGPIIGHAAGHLRQGLCRFHQRFWWYRPKYPLAKGLV